MTLIDAYYPPEAGRTEEFDERITSYMKDAEEKGLETGLQAWINDVLFEPARANEQVRAELGRGNLVRLCFLAPAHVVAEGV